MALLVAVTLAGCSPSRPEGRRVVLVTIDTLRFEDFIGGPERPAGMPRTLAFAERGLLFEQGFAASSSTQPTHASLMTGLHPWEHGVTRNGHSLGQDLETLAERLSAAGFAAHAVVASFPLERRFGFAQGFETYDDSFDRSIGDHAWMGEQVHAKEFYALASSTTRRALAALDGETRPDQFLWVHYFDPHCPYGDSHMAQGRPAPPWGLFSAERLRDEAARRAPKLERMIRRARTGYARDLGFLDSALARLLQRLDADAQRYETHVVIVGDPGESFGEDGSLGHGTRLTRSQVQVPLAVISPRARPARRSDAAGSVDVFATLLDLAGLPAPDGRGRTLLGPPDPAGGSAFGMRRTWGRRAVDQRVDGSVRPIHAPSFFACLQGKLLTGAPNGPVYSSPGGRLQDPELSDQVRQLFGRFASALGSVDSREVEDEGTLEALRALGYSR